MFEITVKPGSNEKIIQILDKTFDYFYVHKFHPDNALSWWTADINSSTTGLLNHAKIRDFTCDVLTNLEGITQIINMNTKFLMIYQFDSEIPGSLLFEPLSDEQISQVLREHGLKHAYSIQGEYLNIKSFDKDFIDQIAEITA